MGRRSQAGTDPAPEGCTQARPALEGEERGSQLWERLQRVRQHSVEMITGLEPEDLCLQGMADASPPKWHLGHTTWFFETFLLEPHLPGWSAMDRRWSYLFNSYYDAVGDRHPRPQRGLLTRPPIDAVLAWRHRVDEGLATLVEQLGTGMQPAAEPLFALLELGLQHEQQHQELLLMDLLDGFSRNPLEPTYREGSDSPEGWYDAAWRANAATSAVSEPAIAGSAVSATPPDTTTWRRWPGGLVEIGHHGPGFHFDNEAPRHRQWLEPFQLATHLVTNADYSAFISEDGYRRPELWMSEGWAVVQQRQWSSPRYWRGAWEFTLAGLRPRQPLAPVRHLSWFEADAYARWAGARLPTEAEWEIAATPAVSQAEAAAHAQAVSQAPAVPQAQALPQAHGLLWQWTASPYRPYPGFRTAAGAVGEYNGKFMSSQMVLRGSCFLTPPDHGRLTYRNFFPPASRWLAGGIRLARDC